MFDLDTWQEVLSTLRRNKLRTLLTACGVFWGSFMLVVMLGFGNGLEAGVIKNMFGFTANAIFVWGGRTSIPHQGLPIGRRVAFTNDDIAIIQQHATSLDALAPRLQLGGWRDGNNVSYGDKTGNFGVMGDYPAFARIEGVNPSAGRFINELDMSGKRKVAVIGDEVRRILFEDAPTIGKYIKIRGAHFQVVGVYRSTRPGESGDRANNTVHIPFTTFQSTFSSRNRVGSFAISARPDIPAESLESEIRALLAAEHSLHPSDRQALGSFNLGEKFARMQNLFTGVRLFIWLVAVATLGAGALGVSNIMLISVTERTKEIGIRKALGATPASVILLVVEEALLLTALAGYSGVVAGVMGLELANRILPDQSGPLSAPSIDLSSALYAALVLMAAGVVSGIAPARRAAHIKPVAALRAE